MTGRDAGPTLTEKVIHETHNISGRGIAAHLAAAVPLTAAVWLMAQPAGGEMDGFSTVEAASVSDAMEQLYGQRAYMSPEMRPLSATKFAGRPSR